MSKQTERFVKGALILSLAGILAKVISMFFRIPLVHLVGNEGAGYYTTVYPIFSLLIAIGIVGIPSAISKLIAEDIAVGAHKRAHKTFRDALILSIIFGASVSLLLFFGADTLISLGGWGKETKYVIWGLAPAPLFVCISGVIRGYFQGYQKMKPTAISQIVENFGKVLIGISLVYILIHQGFSMEQAVGGAAIGATTGIVLASVYMMISYKVGRKGYQKAIDLDNSKQTDSFGQHVKRIIVLAIPVSIATAAMSIMNFIDSSTIYHQMAKIGYDQHFVAEVIGQFGNAASVINFPLIISVALSISIIPAISESMTKRNTVELNKKISQGIKIAVMIALPAAAGLYLLARPVMILLYPSADGYQYLQWYSICLVFIIVGQTITGILQGISKQNMPLIALAAAIVVKVVLNLLLIPTALEAEGAVISSVCFYIVFVFVNYLILKKHVTFKLDKGGIFIKPLLATAAMMVLVYFAFPGFMSIFHSNAVVTLLTIGLGVTLYFVILLFTRTFTREELSLLPKHATIIRFLESKKLIK